MVKKNTEKLHTQKNDSIIYSTIAISYMIYGIILLFFGKKIISAFSDLNSIQELGLSLFYVGLASLLFDGLLNYKIKKKSPVVIIIDVIMIFNLIINTFIMIPGKSIYGFLNEVLKSSNVLIVFYLPLICISTIKIKYVAFIENITNPNERITILIGIFGVIIALISVIK